MKDKDAQLMMEALKEAVGDYTDDPTADDGGAAAQRRTGAWLNAYAPRDEGFGGDFFGFFNSIEFDEAGAHALVQWLTQYKQNYTGPNVDHPTRKPPHAQGYQTRDQYDADEAERARADREAEARPGRQHGGYPG